MKTSLLTNLKYIMLGLVLAAGLSLVHADFPAPTTTPPGGNIDVPLHTGPDQVKDGGLSVNTFQALQNAQFKQQTFLNGTVFGGGPTDTHTLPVVIGDAGAPANIAVDGNLSAVSFIKSGSVANVTSSNLCATAQGVIVTCTQSITANPPTLTQIGPTQYTSVSIAEFQVGPSVQPGNVFTFGILNLEIKVTAVAGDTTESIAQKLIHAVNSITKANYEAANDNVEYYTTYDSNGVPTTHTIYSTLEGGYPPGVSFVLPKATSSTHNSSYVIITMDSTHSAAGGAYVSSPTFPGAANVYDF